MYIRGKKCIIGRTQLRSTSIGAGSRHILFAVMILTRPACCSAPWKTAELKGFLPFFSFLQSLRPVISSLFYVPCDPLVRPV